MDISENSIEKRLHKRRLAFAIIGDKCVFTSNDSRSHIDWLRQDYCVSEDEFCNIIRGYVLKDKIYVYKGHQFKEVDDSEIPSDTLIEIVQYANVYNKWGYNKYKVYSGMEGGSIGEVWKPINAMCLINIKTSLRS